MDTDEFRKFGKAAVDFIADYMETLRDRPVLPSVEPGFLQPLIPENAPDKPEPWQELLKDMDRIILPGTTHWESPHFHAYYPSANSYPAIVGEMIASGLGNLGFNWLTGPASTELEVAMMDWLGKMFGLPEEFLNSSDGPGGGLMQGTASEATFLTLLAARDRCIRSALRKNPQLTEAEVLSKLVGYSSDQSNSCVEKAFKLSKIPVKLLPTDNKGRTITSILKATIENDISKGLIPCYMVATLGTTATCSFDELDKIAPICDEFDIWLHLDAAYAGAAFVCPEYRHLMTGIDKVDSVNINLHKWFLVNFDACALWVKNTIDLLNTFCIERVYLKHHYKTEIPDFGNMEIPLGRRFRSLKVWFVLRVYGIEGMQSFIRKQIALAERFENYVRNDIRFEIVTEVALGIVCFRLIAGNEETELLLEKLMERKKIYLIKATFSNKVILRFVICSRNTEDIDVDFAWNEIKQIADDVMRRSALEQDIKCVNSKLKFLQTENLQENISS